MFAIAPVWIRSYKASGKSNSFLSVLKCEKENHHRSTEKFFKQTNISQKYILLSHKCAEYISYSYKDEWNTMQFKMGHHKRKSAYNNAVELGF